jgi:hypothetical protein
MFDYLRVGWPAFEWEGIFEYTTKALNLLRYLRSAVDLVVLSSWPDSILAAFRIAFVSLLLVWVLQRFQEMDSRKGTELDMIKLCFQPGK